jgi:exopolyphosphatase/guanosine-5'-triphosphate,3'-diphosphate pyrophosphatase
MIRASIDIGSNSTLLLVAEMEPKFRLLESESRVTGLGRELDLKKEFIQVSMDETLEAIQEYVSICHKHGVDPENIIATATEASRVSANAQSFYQKVKKITGVDVKVITPEAEAYYSAKGILLDATFEETEIVIMDIGGASTELIKVNSFTAEVIDSISMPFGAVRLTNWLERGVSDVEVQKIKFAFDSKLGDFRSSKVYCVAGTMTSVGNMFLGNKDFVESEVHGQKMRLDDVYNLLDQYKETSPEEMLKLFPYLGKRAKSIHGGLIVANSVLSWIEAFDIQISTYGLRYGTLLEGSIPKGRIYHAK